MTDVKETRELLVAMVRVGKFVMKQAADGIDFTDGVALVKALADEDFRKDVMAGGAGIDQIPAEMKDLSASEALELFDVILEQLKK